MDRYTYNKKMMEIEKLEKRLLKASLGRFLLVAVVVLGLLGGTNAHRYYLRVYRQGSKWPLMTPEIASPGKGMLGKPCPRVPASRSV